MEEPTFLLNIVLGIIVLILLIWNSILRKKVTKEIEMKMELSNRINSLKTKNGQSIETLRQENDELKLKLFEETGNIEALEQMLKVSGMKSVLGKSAISVFDRLGYVCEFIEEEGKYEECHIPGTGTECITGGIDRDNCDGVYCYNGEHCRDAKYEEKWVVTKPSAIKVSPK